MYGQLETSYTFRNMESTEALREHTEDELDKLHKYLIKQNASAHVIFKVEGVRHLAEITLTIRGGRYACSNTSDDMYASVDSAVKKLEKQLSKNKEKITGHHEA